MVVLNLRDPKNPAEPRGDCSTAAVAAIAAVLNAVNREEVAHVFRGDGATLLMSAVILFDVAAALHDARLMAKQAFGLDLHVSLVWAEELAKRTAPVRIAKTEVAPGVYQAALAGVGLRLAESIALEELKAGAGKGHGEHDLANIYSPKALAEKHANYRGFESSWLPVTSRNGTCLALVAEPRGEKDHLRGAQMKELLAEIERLCGKPEAWRPVQAAQLRPAAGPAALSAEARVRAPAAGPARLWQALSLLSRALLREACQELGLKLGAFDGKTFKDAVAGHTSYFTYDNALRLVMDVTPAQKTALEQRLAELAAEGKLYYGLQAQPAARLESLAFDYAREHLHLADGAEAGLARAARALAKQKTGAK
jgi:hypothetical protein